MSLLQRIFQPATPVDRDALIERGFAPVKGVVDMLFIFTPTTLSERYGKSEGGEAGGDLPPLGITYICGYLIKQGYGVGLLDGCALGLQYDEIIEIVKRKGPKSIGTAGSAGSEAPRRSKSMSA